MPSIFFGYPQRPRSQAETIQAAAIGLRQQLEVNPITWEDLAVDGRVVMSQVLAAIDAADMAIFDITRLNENVLFEAGYAVARGKPVWLTMDSTITTAKSAWNEFGLLKPVGHTSYRNSSDLVALFVEKNPIKTLTPVYDDLIEPILTEPEPRRSVLYCPTFEPFEASSQLSRLIDARRRQGIAILVSDPRESSLDPITWYAPIILKSAGLIVHFASRERNLSRLHNRRHSLVAGLAAGFETPTLLLAEEDFASPFDYEARLRKYDSAADCVFQARRWLDELEFEGIRWNVAQTTRKSRLVGLRFGEHVAENELSDLTDYFVETAAYQEVIAARDTIFIGHRGTGKTANANQAFQTVAANPENMAVFVKPAGLEFSALLAALQELPALQHDYFFDAMWWFIIQTEIASALVTELEERPPGVPMAQRELVFLDYVRDAPFDIRADISVRLEQAMTPLLDLAKPLDNQTGRNLINEAFHARALETLRHELGHVLKKRRRVAIFVDNLDKGWGRGADFHLLARLILGLLTARGRVIRDFQRQDYWRDRIKLTVSIFLRSDIYHYLRREAREPDKLPVSTVAWRDPETLLGVIESRFLSIRRADRGSSALWEDFFCSHVDGKPTREYLTGVVMPRPRDAVYFCNAAVGRAIDRRHDRVEAEDFLAAEETYSQYAYEALLVENGITVPEMEDALLAFLGAESILTRARVDGLLSSVGLPADKIAPIFDKLVAMSFLGVEVRPDEFVFPEVGSQGTKVMREGAILQPDTGSQRLVVHRAFHSFLGIKDADAS